MDQFSRRTVLLPVGTPVERTSLADLLHAALEPVPHALGPHKDDPAVKEETQNYVSAFGVNPIMKGTWGSWCIGGVSQVRH
jgi:hypothetical protein